MSAWRRPNNKPLGCHAQRLFIPRSVTSIGFLLAEKTPGPFVLEVAWLKVVRGSAR